MKKSVIVLIVFLVMLTGLTAQSMKDLPTGSWVDANYGAVWTFSQDNIVLSLTSGEVVFDFKGKIEDFLVASGANGMEVSFKCDEAGRRYKFVKSLNITETSIKMFIERTDGLHYEVVMLMKK